MSDPQKYTRDYSFTDYQASNPSAPLPGLQVDAELEDVEASIGEIVDAIKDVRRSDGALKNGIVTVDSLDATVAAGVGSGALASAEAAAASADAASDSAVAAAASATAAGISETAASGYASNALTSRNEASGFSDDSAAAASLAQTARDFANKWATEAEGVDVDDGVNAPGYSAYHWAQVALDAATGSIADGSVTTAKLADGALSADTTGRAKMADGFVTSAKIADGTIATGDIADSAITSAKIADGTIVTGDLANGAVTSAKLGSDVISLIDSKVELPAVGAISANYAVSVSERGDCINVNATSGAITVTLPAAATAGNGFTLVVKKTDSTTNTVTIDAAGSETIDGALTRVLRFQHQSVALVCNGSAWFVLSEGSIFETGSNANGEYIRFANGWQICTRELSPGVACATAAGNIFFSNGVVAGNFAAAFSSVPVVSVAGTSGSGNGWTLQSVIQTSTTWGTYRHANYASDANTGGKIYLTANGRWF